MRSLLAFALALGVAVALPAADADLIFQEDFEKDLSQWKVQACPGGVTLSSDYMRNGKQSAKFLVHDEDTNTTCALSPTENPRAQLASHGLFKDGDEYFIGFSVLFPKGFPKDDDWFQFIELYGEPYDGSPTMGIYVCNGNQICFKRDETHSHDTIWTGDAIIYDTWRNITLHVKFSTKADIGFVEIWDGGKPQTLANGKARIVYQNLIPAINYKDGTSNAVILNQYRSAKKKLGAVTLYHDSLKIGKTFESVQP